MAFTSSESNGSSGSKSANQSSLAFSPTSNIDAGNLIVLIIGVDNSATTDQDEGAVSGVVDTVGGNTWIKAAEWTNGQGAAQTGATVSMWYCVPVNSVSTGGTITVSFTNSSSRDASAWYLHEFTKSANSTVSVGATNTQVGDGASMATSLDATTVNRAALRFSAFAGEEEASTALVATSGAWTVIGVGGTSGTGGLATSNIILRGEFTISTGTGDASNPTGGVTCDWARVYVAFYEHQKGDALLASAGSVAVDATLGAIQGAALLNGTASVAADATHTPDGASLLSGAATVAADATFPVQTHQGEALFASAGTFATDATHTPGGAALLDSAGTFAADVTHTPDAATLLLGAGSISAEAAHTPDGAALFSGVGTISTEAAHTPEVAALLSGSATVVVEAAHTPEAAALLSGSATVDADAALSGTIQASALLTGVGSLGVSAEIVVSASMLIAAVSSLDAAVTHTPEGSALVAAYGTLLADAEHTPQAVAEFIASGDIVVSSSLIAAAAAAVDGSGVAAAVASQHAAAMALIEANGSLAVDATNASSITAAHMSSLGTLFAASTVLMAPRKRRAVNLAGRNDAAIQIQGDRSRIDLEINLGS